MSFQPFGFYFEFRSSFLPSAVKAAIRSRKKGWFDAKNGARGWIVGPCICLWFSAFDRYGPMLFGFISQEDSGTLVRGRAGSDLNGVVAFSLILLFAAFLTFDSIEMETASIREMAVLAIVFLLGGPLLYWSAHKDRREAEPLVRFLRDILTTSGQKLRLGSADVSVSKTFRLKVDGKDYLGSVTVDAIHDALLTVGAGNFVILEAAPETYLQTAFLEGGYLLEKRAGDKSRHFRAIRRGIAPTTRTAIKSAFTFAEVREAFVAYASQCPMPQFLRWQIMD